MITDTRHMIETSDALEIVRESAPPQRTEELPLTEALGAVLTKDVECPEGSPRYTNSAMDGFAVIWADVSAASADRPGTLRVIGESRAGVPFQGAVESGQAVRISTGAMLPSGADTVVPVEDTDDGASSVAVSSPGTLGQHVRLQGEEFQSGALGLASGTELGPPHIAFLASVGVTSVPVYARPRVSVIITGTELVAHDEHAEPWQIRDSNGPMLASAVRQSGGVPVSTDRAEDSLEAISASIRRAADVSEIVLVSGGVSVGPHDHVKEASVRAGLEPRFWKVRQKPGKPLFVAGRDDVLLFGLPGNPVSALVCYCYYVHPLVTHLTGREFRPRTMQGRLKHPASNDGGRPLFAQVTVRREGGVAPEVRVLERQSSYMLTAVTKADGLVLLNSGESLEEGELVDVYLFPWKA